MVEDIPAVQGAVAAQGAWAAVDHAPMTRTAQSRSNSRRHPKPSAAAPPSASDSPAPTAQPTPAMQPSFMQRNPLLAGLAAGVAGSWIGHMLFGATDSIARTNEAGEHVGEPADSRGFQLHRDTPPSHACRRGAFYYFLKVRRSPTPDFSGIRGAVQSAALCWQNLPPRPRKPATVVTRSPPPTRRPFNNC